MKSNLMQEAPISIRWFANRLAAAPEQVAVGPVYLASSPDVASEQGRHYYLGLAGSVMPRRRRMELFLPTPAPVAPPAG